MAKGKNRIPARKRDKYLESMFANEQQKEARKKMKKQMKRTSSKLYKNITS